MAKLPDIGNCKWHPSSVINVKQRVDKGMSAQEMTWRGKKGKRKEGRKEGKTHTCTGDALNKQRLPSIKCCSLLLIRCLLSFIFTSLGKHL